MPNLRLQILLAIAGIGLIFAFLVIRQQPTAVSAPVITSLEEDNREVCTALLPAKGGDFVEGMVGAPRYLNPVLNDLIPVDRELSALIFDGLVRYDPNTRRFVPALAESWEVAEDGRSITFTLRQNIRWHDGEPFTSEDVAFTYALLQEPTLPASVLWQTVTISPLDEFTIRFTLAEPYAPFLEATSRGILPAHLLEGETAVSLQNHSFTSFPIGTGPFQVDGEQNWTETGQLRLLPNHDYISDGYIDSLTFRFFPDYDQLMQAFGEGTIHAVSTLPEDAMPLLAAQPSARIFTNPVNRYSALIFNQREQEGGNLLALADVRHALAMGLNREQLINEQLAGQGLLLDGPYLPDSWAYAPRITFPMSYNPISATAVLEAQGYFLNDDGLRQSEADTLSLRLIGLRQDRDLLEGIADQWRDALGAEVETAVMASGADLRNALQTGLFDVALVDVSPSLDPDLYDFYSQEAMVRGQNYGQWNNWRASEALEAARQRWRIEERRPFYNTFLRFFQTELPAFTLYQHVESYIVSEDVHQVDIGIIDTPADRYRTFNQWYINHVEQTESCHS